MLDALSFSSSVLNQEFEDSGDPEKHLQDLLALAKEGKEKGKVCSIVMTDLFIRCTFVIHSNDIAQVAHHVIHYFSLMNIHFCMNLFFTS